MTSEPRRPSDRDAYEAKHMAGSGKVLLRDKTRSRPMAGLLLLLAVFALASGLLSLVGPLPIALIMFAAALLFAFCGLGLTVIRSVITREEVHVQLGLWGPRVPIEAITQCRVVEYDWKKFGGWGIKRARDGTWAYTLSARGSVVELSWTGEDGKPHKAVFGAADPTAVAAAIQRARTAATGRVRVGAEETEPRSAAEEAALALAEQEQAAEAETAEEHS